MTVVYLDYNATAPVRPEVLDAMHDALQAVGNASSVHGPGRAARARLDNARDAVARLVNAAPREVYFTSGGTEANYLALRGLPAITRPGQVAVSAIEHDAVLHAAPEGCHRIPVGQDGIVDLSAFEQMLGRDRNREIGLVSVMLANNETGAVQPVAEIARLAHAHGACLHCDGVQAAGKIAIDIAALGADMLSLSAHKLGGPQGVGALVIRNELALRAVQRGGGQERGLRGGTEN
ncbi:MAG TPA: cysteine desulfurase, partial [Alphaproteobacteria bacterium]|nr:cysteine desulfurase [Alphaproteobacteria bacterium]